MIVQPIMILCAMTLIVWNNWKLAVLAVVFFAILALILGKFGGDTFAETTQRLAAYRKQLETYAT